MHRSTLKHVVYYFIVISACVDPIGARRLRSGHETSAARRPALLDLSLTYAAITIHIQNSERWEGQIDDASLARL